MIKDNGSQSHGLIDGNVSGTGLWGGNRGVMTEVSVLKNGPKIGLALESEGRSAEFCEGTGLMSGGDGATARYRFKYFTLDPPSPTTTATVPRQTTGRFTSAVGPQLTAG